MKICLLVRSNQYDSKLSFTKDFKEGLDTLGVETHLVDFSEQESFSLPELKALNPDWTMSFSSFAKASNGQYLWEWLDRPHMHLLLDAPLYYLKLLKAPRSYATVVDEGDFKWVQSVGYSNTYFLPHGATHSLCTLEEEERPIDVLFLGSCYDHLAMRRSMRQALGEASLNSVEAAAERVLRERELSLMDAGDFSFEAACYVDYLVRGIDRFELLRAMEGLDVHVFGDPHPWTKAIDPRGWQAYRELLPHVTFHSGVNFQEGLNLMRKAKVCLNSCPTFKRGAHERGLNALLAGAALMTTDSLWWEKEFSDEVMRYRPGCWDRAADAVRDYLKNPIKRCVGREKVLKKHLWRHRAESLITQVASY